MRMRIYISIIYGYIFKDSLVHVKDAFTNPRIIEIKYRSFLIRPLKYYLTIPSGVIIVHKVIKKIA